MTNSSNYLSRHSASSPGRKFFSSASDAGHPHLRFLDKCDPGDDNAVPWIASGLGFQDPPHVPLVGATHPEAKPVGT
jgi:hypothetical protein